MFDFIHERSFLPSCILGGVGVLFVVLAATLPPVQVFGLLGGSSVVVGLAVARLRRQMPAEREAAPSIRARI